MKQDKAINYQWAVIGAGPAGIAAVGKLMDHGIEANKIAWIDPNFTVGDFGAKWRRVSSNTKVKLFTQFLEESHSFRYQTCKHEFQLQNLHPDEHCELSYAADPLLKITDNIKNQINSISSKALKLNLYDRQWQISLENGQKIAANNVILAIGAEPKTMNFSDTQSISLETALDDEKLLNACHAEDTVAVFGASHSAIMIIRKLIKQCKVRKVINFYQSPLKYAVYLENEILFDDTGLKGQTAQWARENIDGKLPASLSRIFSTPENIQKYLPECNKVISAIGFKKRQLPIEGYDQLHYNDKNGIIAPGLFGLGIAYPEAKTDRFGNIEYRVGLWKFMDYLNRILPIWLKYHA